MPPEYAGARSDLLHGADSTSGHAQSFTCESHRADAGTSLGSTPPHSASPSSSQWRPTRIRGVFHSGMPKRGSACAPGKKTSRVSAIDAVVVEHFEIAISDINELQD